MSRVCEKWNSIPKINSKTARNFKLAYRRHSGYYYPPKLRSDHERRPTDEQDETGRAILHRADGNQPTSTVGRYIYK